MWLSGDSLVDGVSSTRLARELQTEQEELKGKDLPEALATTLYANGVYGKVCQSLRPKSVFDTRTVSSVRLKPSPITNPAIGAYVTGCILGGVGFAGALPALCSLMAGWGS